METILLILGGLCLFLYALSNLSDSLKNILGDRAKKLLSRFTHNIYTGILTGIIITIILDSSGANLDQKLANAHMLFNGLGVLLFLLLVGLSEKILIHLFPERPVDKQIAKKSEGDIQPA